MNELLFIRGRPGGPDHREDHPAILNSLWPLKNATHAGLKFFTPCYGILVNLMLIYYAFALTVGSNATNSRGNRCWVLNPGCVVS